MRDKIILLIACILVFLALTNDFINLPIVFNNIELLVSGLFLMIFSIAWDVNDIKNKK